MKRLIVLLVLGASAVAALSVGTVTAVAALNDAKGPKCVDITSGSIIYNTDGTVTGNVRVAAPACKQVTYTLFVLDEAGDAATLASDNGAATNSAVPEVVFFGTGAVTSADTDVCVYIEARIGGHVFDSAPDVDCNVLEKNGSPGSGGFN